MSEPQLFEIEVPPPGPFWWVLWYGRRVGCVFGHHFRVSVVDDEDSGKWLEDWCMRCDRTWSTRRAD